MRCCLVTLSREAFKPSQFSEADVLSQRLFSLEKILKEGKLSLRDIGFILLLGQTIMTMLGRMQKYLQTCTGKNRQGIKSNTLPSLGFDADLFSPNTVYFIFIFGFRL